jgi:hypothetical protein
MITGGQTLEQAERAIAGFDVAHHVVDPAGLLGLDTLRASPLDEALSALGAAEREAWFLCLPAPGVLGPLRGPAALNRAALEHGEAVVASTAGVALVPIRVGAAIQWRVFEANRPFAPETPYEAERLLNETVLSAAAALARLDVAAGSRPAAHAGIALAPGYGRRQLATAERAGQLIAVCDAALADEGGGISAYEIERRGRELRQLRAAARVALASAVSGLIT